MSVQTTPPRIEQEASTQHLRLSIRQSKLLGAIAILAMVIGLGSMLGGITGAAYTWRQAAHQAIVTPDDASIPGADVRGPFTMLSQSAIINEHQLDRTGGQYYSQMEREVPAVDEAGEPVLDEAGEPVMVPNEARASWVTATTLTTSLGLGVLAYGVSAFAIVVGLTLAALGFVVYRIREAEVSLS